MLSKLSFTIDSIHKAYSEGVTVNELVNESVRRLEKIGDKGIYLHVCDTMELSAALEELGSFDPVKKPLWGIPFAVKDNIDVAGLPTTAACEEFRYIAERDAYVVSRLKQAGAIVIGKTNLDQFATGLVGVRTPFPVPKNAIDESLVPGGSSSGSAVAVAHGQVCFSLGTDTAGSGRIPAALNNIVGLKPSLGSISGTGVVPACRTLDTVSIFALNVQDASTVYACCRHFDKQDAFSKPYLGATTQAIPATLTLAVPDKKSLILDEPEQEEAYRQALDYWRNKGAALIEVDFQPFYEVAKLLYEGPWVAERLAAIESFITKAPRSLHPVTRTIIESANQFSATDVFNAIYRLKALRRELEPVLDSVDALCVPSMPGLVYTKDLEVDPIGPNSRLGTYTNFVNLLDLCGISVPGKVRTDGYPSSITLIAPSGHDAFVHVLAAGFHADQACYLGATENKLAEPSLALDSVSA